MHETPSASAMLPSGLYDLIGAEATGEAELVNQLIGQFDRFGYDRVQPPLMEYAASLLDSRPDSELARKSLRVMDPLSGQMLALRADMTMQIARIAGGPLATAPRPLRLCYAGQTLQAAPDTMRAARQFRQIGIELLGVEDTLADAEILQITLTALGIIGLKQLTLDLSLPALLPALMRNLPEAQHQGLLEAIRHKNIGQIERMQQPEIARLCALTGPAEETLAEIAKIALPQATIAPLQQISALLAHLKARMEDIAVTITFDPLEMRGFGYHSGISYAIYTPAAPRELGRGGRYRTPGGEAACGFTFYSEDILPLLEQNVSSDCVLLDAEATNEQAQHWQQQGFRTRYAMSTEVVREATRLGCVGYIDPKSNKLNKVEPL